jgi:hypothetical protein
MNFVASHSSFLALLAGEQLPIFFQLGEKSSAQRRTWHHHMMRECIFGLGMGFLGRCHVVEIQPRSLTKNILLS